jgi:hypothetical protein
MLGRSTSLAEYVVPLILNAARRVSEVSSSSSGQLQLTQELELDALEALALPA